MPGLQAGYSLRFKDFYFQDSLRRGGHKDAIMYKVEVTIMPLIICSHTRWVHVHIPVVGPGCTPITPVHLHLPIICVISNTVHRGKWKVDVFDVVHQDSSDCCFLFIIGYELKALSYGRKILSLIFAETGENYIEFQGNINPGKISVHCFFKSHLTCFPSLT